MVTTRVMRFNLKNHFVYFPVISFTVSAHLRFYWLELIYSGIWSSLVVRLLQHNENSCIFHHNDKLGLVCCLALLMTVKRSWHSHGTTVVYTSNICFTDDDADNDDYDDDVYSRTAAQITGQLV